MAEHLKSKSTGGFHQGDGSPCTSIITEEIVKASNAQGEADTRAADGGRAAQRAAADERAGERAGHADVHPEERGQADQQGGRVPPETHSRTATGLGGMCNACFSSKAIK